MTIAITIIATLAVVGLVNFCFVYWLANRIRKSFLRSEVERFFERLNYRM